MNLLGSVRPKFRTESRLTKIITITTEELVQPPGVWLS